MYRLLEDDALINRMGFNNIGMNKALWNLRRHAYTIPVGLNVGVNKRHLTKSVIKIILKSSMHLKQMYHFSL